MTSIWYGPPRCAWPLWPLSGLYALGAALHRLPYRLGWRKAARLPVPVIVVGNLTVGGTGKTPLVIHLARALAAQGERPGILCRGYGGRVRRWPQRVTPASDPVEVGDEPVLIAQRTGLPVAAGPSRARAGQLLLDAGCTVLLTDDGLQHHALARDMEIAVVDGARGLGNGLLLPAGPLRESARRLERVDAVVVQGEGFTPAHAATFRMTLPLSEVVDLATRQERRPLADFAGEAVHALAGIGHPRRFFDALRAAGLRVVEHPFPDHYDYRPQDLVFAAAGPIFMTEKDAVKCARLNPPNAWVAPVEAQLTPDLADWVRTRLRHRDHTKDD
ncbi:MAG: tetraacyldisaccharide 4'-kinase [Pseudomonadota bacterium]